MSSRPESRSSRPSGELLTLRHATLAWFLAGLAALPKLVTLPGLRLLDDPVTTTILSILLSRLAPVAFLVLVVYLLVAEFVWSDAPTTAASRRSPTTLLGAALAGVYVLFSLAVWIDPYAVADVVNSVIYGISRTIYTSPAIEVVDPVALRDVELDLRRAVRQAANALVRSPGQAVRWPAYLFVSYLAVAGLTDGLGWFDDATRTLRFAVRAFVAVFALVYGLVISHNFFPGPDALPWRDATFTLWLAVHTGVSVVVLALLRSIPSRERDSQSFVSTTVVVALLLGVVVAVVDGLSPIPELLLLGVLPVAFTGRWLSVPRLDEFTIRAADVESQLLDGLAAAWRDPPRLFAVFPAVQGFWLGGWVTWLGLFGVGSPLSESSSASPVITALVVALLSPILAAAAYWMWFWVGEIRRLSSTADAPARPPDLLVFPTTTIASFLVADRLFGVHVALGLLAVGGVLLGVAGMAWSLRTRRADRELSWVGDGQAVPVAFLVQFGGLELASHVSPSQYGPSGSYLALLLVTLVPLYFYPGVRRDGLGPLAPLPASLGLVTAVTGCSVLYLSRVDTYAIVNSAVLGVAAVVLAWSLVYSDITNGLGE